ncbi:hypothetical protein GE061_002988 [Apolygus lucorum]|uniref:Phospholipid/glycerol acyltransferase domain-containing protein n=1 Tax=Apolygus lucorum TaxID=248454 RepID=A0A8S9X089_APOLU|nr:hypothetical protein GE061_002988 [Apolygus lucorum]
MDALRNSPKTDDRINEADYLLMGAADVPWMFDWVEYIVFVVMLCVSALIGIYFGCIKGGQDTVTGYLLGGKQMSLIPISISLVTTYISGITLLGVPSEIYTYGSQYLTSNLANYLVGLITAFFILPVFYKLQLISLYEYMELRFGHGVRIIVSVLFTISLISYIPVVIYGPALALNQVTGIDVQWVSIVVSLVCIFYTTLGGLEAVVWTDTIQGFMMVLSIATVLIVGTIRVGGVGHVIATALEGGRVEFFNMDPDPTVRLTFWSSFVGVTFFWSAHFAFSPASMQRYISLPTFRDAQKSVIFLCIGVSFFITMSGMIGFVMYTHFKDCDPLSSGLITRPDQILPLFVIKVCGDIKGLSGLFLSGVVCAALSSMSAGLNTVAGTFYEDFLEPAFNEKPSEKKASFVMKVLVVIFGFISVCMVSVIEKLGAILEISAAFGGMTAGTTLGLFLLGLLFPWANNKGAMVGGLTSLICMAWMTVGQYVHKTSSDFRYPSKPMSIDGCNHNFTLVTPPASTGEDIEIPFVFRLSIFYYSMLGALIVVFVGLVVSCLTGVNRLCDVNPDLLSPIVHPLLTQKAKSDVIKGKSASSDVKKSAYESIAHRRSLEITLRSPADRCKITQITSQISTGTYRTPLKITDFEMNGSRWRGVVYCFFWFMSIFSGWLLLCVPLLPVLLVDVYAYRTAVDLVFAMWETYPVALMEMLFSTEFVLSGDQVRPWERSILIMNHRTRLDWNFLWAAMHYGTTTPAHRLKFILKRPISLIPGPGWVMQMCGFFFIHRKWEKDQMLLDTMIGHLDDLDYTYQVLIFPEGTDLTEKSMTRSNSYADQKGLDRYSQVLHPKTTGFSYLVERMNHNDRLDAVYDLTVGYPDNMPETESDVARGHFPERVHFNIKRYGIDDLPNGEENLRGWLSSLWKDKEEKLSGFYSHSNPSRRMFEDPQQKLNRWPRPLSNGVYLAAIFWTGIVFMSIYLFVSSCWFKIYVFVASGAFAVLSHKTEGMYHQEIAWAKRRKAHSASQAVGDRQTPVGGAMNGSNGRVKSE